MSDRDVFYVMYMKEEHCDPNAFGGGCADWSEDLGEAIEMAKTLTRAGVPCQVEGFGSEILWEPGKYNIKS